MYKSIIILFFSLQLQREEQNYDCMNYNRLAEINQNILMFTVLNFNFLFRVQIINISFRDNFQYSMIEIFYH